MSDSESSSSTPEVKWQVAWFALLALGLAAMLQPCGNVLCQKANNYRFYIRAAPIVCIADVAQSITFILLGFSSDLQTWLQNIKFELKERFEGEAGTKDRENAENSIIIRWILMILGASQFNAIKLMAMQGIPWTQAWAMMFAISIVFGEVLILLVRFLSLDDSSAYTLPAWRSYKISNALNHIGIVPVSLQFALSYGSFWVYCWKKVDLSEEMFAQISISLVFCLIFFSPIFLSLTQSLKHGTAVEWKRYQYYSLGCFAVISSLIFPYYERLLSFSDPGLPWFWLWYATSSSSCIILWGMANNIPRFIHTNILGRICRVDDFQGSQAATLCFLTFLASILYYGVLYNPSGTKNPEWTGIFG